MFGQHARQRSAPCRDANVRRNAQAEIDRPARWKPARDALWRLLDPLLAADARIAIVGAGNCDDLPLTRITNRAGQVALIDLDPHAARHARGREPRTLRNRISVIEHDITAGVADQIVNSAITGPPPDRLAAPHGPLPGAPYDLVIGDLFYSQLIYPALIDRQVDPQRTRALISRYSAPLTRGVVSRLHASSADGCVIHLHDPLAWWPGHHQPVTPDEVLTTAGSHGTDAALDLAARGRGPSESDPRAALLTLGIPIRHTALWHWPFTPTTSYLVCATVA